MHLGVLQRDFTSPVAAKAVVNVQGLLECASQGIVSVIGGRPFDGIAAHAHQNAIIVPADFLDPSGCNEDVMTRPEIAGAAPMGA
jgi:hypothetical protein